MPTCCSRQTGHRQLVREGLRLPLQDCSERGYATCRVTFHGAPADAHGCRDIRLGKVGVIPQHERFALARGERTQRSYNG